ncbi:MAG: 16S rRNA (cytosine(1402)-N(4))-methyltransferase RsmH [Gammaproteobacteria bacterium]|nr:16S rRNA (cytosine(1402)-N(4))-methyltransferase RsmH [Gammaproteobacteria bacterium]
MGETFRHTTVLLDEAVNALAIEADGFYVDGTYGRGGHSQLILEQLGEHGHLIGIDKDPEAITHGQEIHNQDVRLTMYQGSFATIKALAEERDFLGKIDGVLLDLGVSSPQLDDADRGFSFLRDGPLDMRMDPTSGISAADWLASAEEDEITDVLKRFGEEKFGKRIARAILDQRKTKPLTTTHELVELIDEAVPVKDKYKHPATRSFQGIRIFVNEELSDLEKVLEGILEVLKPGGRMVIISFHSLEDRMVKRFIRKHVQGDDFPIGLPVTEEQLNKRLKAHGKAIKANKKQTHLNPRARSAVMRVAEKLR